MMLLILGLIILLSFLYCFLNRQHGYLEKLALPMEKSFLCFGSPPFNWHQLLCHEYYSQAFKRFKSKTFTRYAGSTPTIVTIDPDIIKQVTIKQFNNFPMTLNMEMKDKYRTLDATHGPLWKLLRKELSPVFTSGKLKGMLEPVSEIGDAFVAYIEKQRTPGKAILIKKIFQGLTIDIFNTCVYGIKTNSREEASKNHQLITASKAFEEALVSHNWGTNLFILAVNLVPKLNKYLGSFGSEFNEIINMANSVIHQREDKNIKKMDFINVLVEMRKRNREVPNELLNEEIITAQAVIFFLAGYSTTAITLSNITYLLAINPEIQDKLFQEIMSSGSLEFNETSYLTAVIKETLRMYPPAMIHRRVCTHDTQVEGIFVKNGTIVEMPIYASHFDPDFFPNPEEFRPERFLSASEIIPNTYRPFGNGNRSCIANRFAMMELHILAEKIVKKFKILATHETKMVPRKGAIFIYDFEDIGVEFVPRL